MPKKVTRRSFIKKLLTSFISLTGLSIGGYYYAHNIEPHLLDINTIPINHPEIPKGFENFKIIQFSDTHLGFQYDLVQLKKLVKQINSLKPDIVFFTGDLMDAPNMYSNTKELIPVLKEINAPFGKFAIYGNHDHGGYGSNIYKEVMNKSDFTLLLNESKKVELIDKSKIYIVGIDDAMLGNPNIDLALNHVPNNAFKVLLSHAPDLADTAASYNIQLQLSGHSHGGQIRIPFLGALVTPPFGEKYIEGMYTIGTKQPLTLYVNRGLGTTRLPFRFLAKPELTILTLSSKPK